VTETLSMVRLIMISETGYSGELPHIVASANLAIWCSLSLNVHFDILILKVSVCVGVVYRCQACLKGIIF